MERIGWLGRLEEGKSGDIFLFDPRTRAVMAHPRGQDVAVKEKVAAVREVVPTRSNNEIVLVLQYYDYSVEYTIQAFLEDGAKEALQEWHFHGNKPNNKKKRKNKKKEDPKPAESQSSKSGKDNVPASVPNLIPAQENCHAQIPFVNGTDSINQSNSVPNGHGPLHEISSLSSSVTTVSMSTSTSLSGKEAQGGAAPLEKSQSHQQRPNTLDKHSSSVRERTWSEKSTSSSGSKRPYSGLEKSVKDLQRQTSSLQRLDRVLGEELERSYKSITVVFDELRLALSEREADIIFEMDKVKQHANDTLTQRKFRAAELKVKTDQAQAMKEAAVVELRSDIKQFVSDRKVDEDLSRTTRFNCNVQSLLQEIQKFGEVVPVRHQYNIRRPSASSISSSIVSHDDLLSPTTPTSSVPSTPSHQAPPVLNGPVMQASGPKLNTTVTDSATLHDLAELQQKFHTALKLQGLPTRSPTRRNPSNPRPQSGNRDPHHNRQTVGQRRPQSPNKSVERYQKPSQNVSVHKERQQSDSQISPDSGDSNKSRNARRRQARRERDRERRQNSEKNGKDETDHENQIIENKSDKPEAGPVVMNSPDQKPQPSEKPLPEKIEPKRKEKINRTPSPMKNRPRYRGPPQHSQIQVDGNPGRGKEIIVGKNGDKGDSQSNLSQPHNGTRKNELEDSKTTKSQTNQVDKMPTKSTKSNSAVVSVKAELSEKGDAALLNSSSANDSTDVEVVSNSKPGISRKPRPRRNTPRQDQVNENGLPPKAQNGTVYHGTEANTTEMIPNHVMDKALPQRKPRDRPQREVKRAEVIVNGDHPEVVNGVVSDKE